MDFHLVLRAKSDPLFKADPQLLPRPQAPKVKSCYTAVPGKVMKARLRVYGISVRQFARITGINGATAALYFSGKVDGRVPLWVEVILELLDVKPVVRHRFKMRDRGANIRDSRSTRTVQEIEALYAKIEALTQRSSTRSGSERRCSNSKVNAVRLRPVMASTRS